MPETALWRLGSQSVEGVVLCTGSRCRKWYEWCLRKGYYRACWYYPGCSITSSLTVLLLVISKYSTVIFIQNFLQRTPFAFQINFVFVRFSLLLIFHIIVVGRMDLERRKCFFLFINSLLILTIPPVYINCRIRHSYVFWNTMGANNV